RAAGVSASLRLAIDLSRPGARRRLAIVTRARFRHRRRAGRFLGVRPALRAGLRLETLSGLAAAHDGNVPGGVLARIENGVHAMIEQRTHFVLAQSAVPGERRGIAVAPCLNDRAK